MKDHYTTSRLSLSKLSFDDAEFILELVNMPQWIQFIGDRNIHNVEDANKYIQKISENSNIKYWVAKIRDTQIPIGVITFIKREYLKHYDIGFAFLERYGKKGLAYEAAAVVMDDLKQTHSHILATTVRENANSIRLLEKLGLRFEREIQVDDEQLLVYSMRTDKGMIDKLTQDFFGLFTNTHQRQPDFKNIETICLPETIIIRKNAEGEVVYNLQSFIEPRKKILSDGTLTEFEEGEMQEETKITGNLAQRFSKYTKSGYLNGSFFQESGTKLFQFVKTKEGWKINSVIWEDDVK